MNLSRTLVGTVDDSGATGSDSGCDMVQVHPVSRTCHFYFPGVRGDDQNGGLNDLGDLGDYDDLARTRSWSFSSPSGPLRSA